MLRKRIWALACFATIAIAAQAGATTTVETYSYRSWVNTLIGSPTEADFSHVAYTSYNTSSGINLSGASGTSFTFTGPDNGGYSLTGQRYNNILSLAGAADSNAGINIAFSGTGQNAFLVSVGSTGNDPLSLVASDGETFSITSGVYGFSFAHPITWAYLTTAATSQAVVNDFYYGTSSLAQDGGSTPVTPSSPTPAPECATALLVLGGGLVMFAGRRKVLVALAA